MKKLAGDEKPVIVVEAVLDPVGVDFTVVRVQVDIQERQIAVIVTPEQNMQNIIYATAL